MNRLNRILASIVLVCFLFNTALQDYAFGLGVMPGTTQEATRLAALQKGIEDLAEKRPEVVASLDIDPMRFVPTGVGIRPITADELSVPKSWELVDFRGWSFSLAQELSLRSAGIKFYDGNFDWNVVYRLVGRGDGSLSIEFNRSFDRAYDYIRHRDIGFEYAGPDGSKVTVGSLALYIFNVLLVMTKLSSSAEFAASSPEDRSAQKDKALAEFGSADMRNAAFGLMLKLYRESEPKRIMAEAADVLRELADTLDASEKAGQPANIRAVDIRGHENDFGVAYIDKGAYAGWYHVVCPSGLSLYYNRATEEINFAGGMKIAEPEAQRTGDAETLSDEVVNKVVIALIGHDILAANLIGLVGEKNVSRFGTKNYNWARNRGIPHNKVCISAVGWGSLEMTKEGFFAFLQEIRKKDPAELVRFMKRNTGMFRPDSIIDMNFREIKSALAEDINNNVIVGYYFIELLMDRSVSDISILSRMHTLLTSSEYPLVRKGKLYPVIERLLKEAQIPTAVETAAAHHAERKKGGFLIEMAFAAFGIVITPIGFSIAYTYPLIGGAITTAGWMSFWVPVIKAVARMKATENTGIKKTIRDGKGAAVDATQSALLAMAKRPEVFFDIAGFKYMDSVRKHITSRIGGDVYGLSYPLREKGFIENIPHSSKTILTPKGILEALYLLYAEEYKKPLAKLEWLDSLGINRGTANPKTLRDYIEFEAVYRNALEIRFGEQLKFRSTAAGNRASTAFKSARALAFDRPDLVQMVQSELDKRKETIEEKDVIAKWFYNNASDHILPLLILMSRERQADALAKRTASTPEEPDFLQAAAQRMQATPVSPFGRSPEAARERERLDKIGQEYHIKLADAEVAKLYDAQDESLRKIEELLIAGEVHDICGEIIIVFSRIIDLSEGSMARLEETRGPLAYLIDDLPRKIAEIFVRHEKEARNLLGSDAFRAITSKDIKNAIYRDLSYYPAFNESLAAYIASAAADDSRVSPDRTSAATREPELKEVLERAIAVKYPVNVERAISGESAENEKHSAPASFETYGAAKDSDTYIAFLDDETAKEVLTQEAGTKVVSISGETRPIRCVIFVNGKRELYVLTDKANHDWINQSNSAAQLQGEKLTVVLPAALGVADDGSDGVAYPSIFIDEATSTVPARSLAVSGESVMNAGIPSAAGLSEDDRSLANKGALKAELTEEETRQLAEIRNIEPELAGAAILARSYLSDANPELAVDTLDNMFQISFRTAFGTRFLAIGRNKGPNGRDLMNDYYISYYSRGDNETILDQHVDRVRLVEMTNHYLGVITVATPAAPYTGTGEGIGDAEAVAQPFRAEFEKIAVPELAEAALAVLNKLKEDSGIRLEVKNLGRKVEISNNCGTSGYMLVVDCHKPGAASIRYMPVANDVMGRTTILSNVPLNKIADKACNMVYPLTAQKEAQKEGQTPISALADTQDALGEVAEIIDEFKITVNYANREIPAKRLGEEELRGIIEAVNLFHQDRIEIFMDKTVDINERTERIIDGINAAIRKKAADKGEKEPEDIITCGRGTTVFSDEQDLERLLKRSPRGKRIIITAATDMARRERLIAMLPWFSGVRLINVAPPDGYDAMNEKEKSFFQLEAVETGIYGRVIEQDSPIWVWTAFAKLLEGAIDDVNGFIDDLVKPEGQWGSQADRVRHFLGRMVRLSRKIAEEYELLKLRMRTFYVAA